MAEFRDKEGNIYRVPDSEVSDIEVMRASGDYEEISQPISQTGVPSTQERQKRESGPGRAISALRGLGQGTTFGFGEHLGGLGAMIGDWAARQKDLGYEGKGPSYREQVEEERRANAKAAKDHPGYYFGGELLGAASIPLPAAKAAGVLGRAGIGGVTGALQAVGQSDAETGQQITRQAIMGGATGAAMTPVVEGATNLAIKGGTKLARKVGEILDPTNPMETIVQDVTDAAKRNVGPSRVEAAERAIAEKEAASTDLEREIGESQSLIGEHGKNAQDAIVESNISQVSDDLSGVVKGNDAVMTQASTGLKGTAAVDALTQRFASIPDTDKKAVQSTIFNRSGKRIDHVKDVISKIKVRAGKGLAGKGAGPKASKLEKMINEYDRRLSEAQSAPYLGLGRGGIEPEAMSDTYIALDVIKRELGRAQEGISGDALSKDEIKGAYEYLRNFLEDEITWGPEVTSMQKNINHAWEKYLRVEKAVKSSFMRGRSQEVIKGADPFENITEADVAKVTSFLSDPASKLKAADRRNLVDWLQASEDLTTELTKYYKNVPELQQEVARIKGMRQRILSNLERAGEDAARYRKVGAKPHEIAAEVLSTARRRGVRSSSLDEIDRLQAENATKALRQEGIRGEIARRKAADLEPPGSLKIQRGRLSQDRDYARQLSKEQGRLYDEYPDVRLRAARSLQRGVKYATPGSIGYISGKGTSVLSPIEKPRDTVSAMWGNRPISEEEDSERDPRIEAGLRVNAYQQNMRKPKLNSK